MNPLTDTRPLIVRVKALATRYDAMASGARKKAAQSIQIAQNYEEDARTLHEAVKVLGSTTSPVTS